MKALRTTALGLCITLVSGSAVASGMGYPLAEVLQGFARLIEGEPEVVLILPDFARPEGKDALRTTVHGWVFEQEQSSTKRRLFKKAIASQLDLEKDTPEYETFERRMTWFLVDNESDQEVDVTVGSTPFPMPASDDDGHFRSEVVVKRQESKDTKQGSWLPVETKLGRVRWKFKLPIAGDGPVAVISDIDDTIKDSNVLDRKELLLNSFVRPFRPVDGMAKKYQGWAKRGAQFHYLSASPWNLYADLATFIDEHGFPTGALYLRTFRLTPTNLHEFATGSREHKLSTIRRLLAQYPKKRFVLVGDSGEHDPEIYGTIAQESPKRIEKVYIRRVPGADNTPERFQKALGLVVPWELLP